MEVVFKFATILRVNDCVNEMISDCAVIRRIVCQEFKRAILKDDLAGLKVGNDQDVGEESRMRSISGVCTPSKRDHRFSDHVRFSGSSE